MRVEVCRDFQNGMCNRGAACRYVHSAQPAAVGAEMDPYRFNQSYGAFNSMVRMEIGVLRGVGGMR